MQWFGAGKGTSYQKHARQCVQERFAKSSCSVLCRALSRYARFTRKLHPSIRPQMASWKKEATREPHIHIPNSIGLFSTLAIAMTITSSITWVGPPPTNSGILGICKDLDRSTITSCGHYYWVRAQPKVLPCLLAIRLVLPLAQIKRCRERVRAMNLSANAERDAAMLQARGCFRDH